MIIMIIIIKPRRSRTITMVVAIACFALRYPRGVRWGVIEGPGGRGDGRGTEASREEEGRPGRAEHKLSLGPPSLPTYLPCD